MPRQGGNSDSVKRSSCTLLPAKRRVRSDAEERVVIAADGEELTVWMGGMLDASTHNAGIGG
jgi:hypothetical protein